MPFPTLANKPTNPPTQSTPTQVIDQNQDKLTLILYELQKVNYYLVQMMERRPMVQDEVEDVCAVQCSMQSGLV